ncbi:acyl-CoA desaturase [Microbacterium sp. Bi128]|uniref:fatty acid desaturase family protein n=1 Tax=Microbacterium sp. Bi128 TaxID=2821115 RepID=UPI001DD8EECD|nr:acyl-CoA desaturase [Microbacterium sp. Bi128]CAH0308819.1 Fatty acid desaturase [Microbacterium sp. Bi128]
MNEFRTTTPRSTATRRATGSEFTELAKTIRELGLLRRRHGYYWTRIIGLPAVLGVALVAFTVIGDTWWQLVTADFLGILFTQIAFLGHDAAHRQIFTSGTWNDWISLILGDLFVGMSYGWWQHKHTRHHARPNTLGSDPDIELPVIVVAPGGAPSRRTGLTWVRAHQGVLFFPILLLEGLSLHASGVREVFTRGRMPRRWVEIVFLTIRLAGFPALVFVILSPGIGFAFLGVQLGVFGFCMGMSFAPNHKGMPILPEDARIDFLRRQVMTSRNVAGTRLLDVAMGGLNYQIEHHLFPSMPRPHLRKAAPIVSAYCHAHGVPYTRTGLLASYAIVVRYINRVGLGERDVFTCPLVDQRNRPPIVGTAGR